MPDLLRIDLASTSAKQVSPWGDEIVLAEECRLAFIPNLYALASIDIHKASPPATVSSSPSQIRALQTKRRTSPIKLFSTDLQSTSWWTVPPMSNSTKYVKLEALPGTGKDKGENCPSHAGVIQENIFLYEAPSRLG